MILLRDIKEEFKKERPMAFERHFDNIHSAEGKSGVLMLYTRSRITADYLTHEYSEPTLEIAQKLLPSIKEVRFIGDV